MQLRRSKEALDNNEAQSRRTLRVPRPILIALLTLLVGALSIISGVASNLSREGASRGLLSR